ncbi:MAG: prolipoprotein diacylglyceryl transferase [Chloroflexota bacterium]|nr:prolipoprotein diacylglyceryl transferase [Chloroflexota bacterium]
MFIPGAISIPFSPYIIDFGPFLLSWHGFFTFVAVATAVYLTVRWGRREGLDGDAILSISVWCIIGGIVGARILHVIDFWSRYSANPISIFMVWQGGIAIFGAIIGGFIFGAAYILIRNSNWFLALWGKFFRFAGEPEKAPLPGVGRLADVAAPALLVAMAIGRLGDIINGEHWAKFTDLPWGVVYSHIDSPGAFRAASHPAVAYELLMDLAIFAIIWPLRNRIRPDGMIFVLYGAMYSIGRFFISFLRVEANTYFGGALNEAQIVSLIVVLITVPLLVYKAQFVRAPRRRAAAPRRQADISEE